METPTPRPAGTRFAVRRNNRIAYDPGRSPAEGAPAVVLLHDLLADRTAFAGLAAALGASTRVLAPDARGHGASATLANQWYTVAELAQDVLAVLDAEGIERAHVAGHGLGGVVALELAQRSPERVGSLTLVEPALYGLLNNDAAPRAMHLREERRAVDRGAADAAYKGLTDRALETYLVPRFGPAWKAAAEPRRLAAFRRHAGALAGILPALDGYAVLKPELGKLAMPALVVSAAGAGELDRLVADRLGQVLPHVTRLELALGDRLAAPFAGETATTLAVAIRALIEENRG